MTKLTLSMPIIALSLLAGTAHAGGVSPFYIGAGVGQGMHDLEGCGGSSSVTLTDPKSGHAATFDLDKACEEKDTAYQVYGGFHFSENLSVEMGYANLGTTTDVTTHFTAPNGKVIGSPNTTQETSAIFAAGVARMPLGKASPVSVYGKAGVHRWSSEAQIEAYNPFNNQTASVTVKDSGVSPLIGAGVEFDVSEGATLRAGWDRYYSTGEEENFGAATGKPTTLDADIDVISAGLNYYFL